MSKILLEEFELNFLQGKPIEFSLYRKNKKEINFGKLPFTKKGIPISYTNKNLIDSKEFDYSFDFKEDSEIYSHLFDANFDVLKDSLENKKYLLTKNSIKNLFKYSYHSESFNIFKKSKESLDLVLKYISEKNLDFDLSKKIFNPEFELKNTTLHNRSYDLASLMFLNGLNLKKNPLIKSTFIHEDDFLNNLTFAGLMYNLGEEDRYAKFQDTSEVLENVNKHSAHNMISNSNISELFPEMIKKMVQRKMHLVNPLTEIDNLSKLNPKEDKRRISTLLKLKKTSPIISKLNRVYRTDELVQLISITNLYDDYRHGTAFESIDDKFNSHESLDKILNFRVLNKHNPKMNFSRLIYEDFKSTIELLGLK